MTENNDPLEKGAAARAAWEENFRRLTHLPTWHPTGKRANEIKPPDPEAESESESGEELQDTELRTQFQVGPDGLRRLVSHKDVAP